MVFNTFTIAGNGLLNLTENLFKYYSTSLFGSHDRQSHLDNPTPASTSSARGLLFNQAFAVAKDFFEKASLNTVEDLQTVGNGFIPSPPWVSVIKTYIPLETRLLACQKIIEVIGDEEVDRVLGGREWWQRNASSGPGTQVGGVKAEWISMKKDYVGFDNAAVIAGEDLGETDLKHVNDDKKLGKASKARLEKEREKLAKKNEKERQRSIRKASEDIDFAGVVEEEEASYSSEMDDSRCMLYIHGGGAFFGSINTHRYAIWRMARKANQRCFAIEYRLAPQYPFPCALSDALAAYLYLIDPPPGAQHKAVDPLKLTVGGDSAGAGIALSLLCLIRDSNNLPMPAGAVLISPWVDLTHSFPSILTNTETDVIPPYGFMFKPSALWPPPVVDTLAPATAISTSTSNAPVPTNSYEDIPLPPIPIESPSKSRKLLKKKSTQSINESISKRKEKQYRNASHVTPGEHVGPPGERKAVPSAFLKVVVDGEEIELRDQIQLYATNEQLTFPYVSPIWQPSLGGLCPLYVLAGDKEVLRDEIIYMAHRAANPEQYQVREELRDFNPARSRLAATYGPTKVHLQVYDECPHDLPLFSFLNVAKYAYRAIASFQKSVTTPSLSAMPPVPIATPSPPLTDGAPVRSTRSRSESIGANLRRALSFNQADDPSSPTNRPPPIPKQLLGIEHTIYSALQPFNRPPYVDNMIRERVGMNGHVRPLEPVHEMAILQIDPEELGRVKEGPAKRYLAGKAIWDKKFAKTYHRVEKERAHHLSKSMKEQSRRLNERKESARANSTSIELENDDLNGGVYNLHGENPPPSSIAARKDTREARELASLLDEHYSKLKSLRLWQATNQIGLARSREDKLGEEWAAEEVNMGKNPGGTSNDHVRVLATEAEGLVEEPEEMEDERPHIF